jgi:hypothetical protein
LRRPMSNGNSAATSNDLVERAGLRAKAVYVITAEVSKEKFGLLTVVKNGSVRSGCKALKASWSRTCRSPSGAPSPCHA